MKNSWKLGSLAGIEIFVHWSFAALIGWVALSYLSGGGGLLSAAFGICFLLAVFGCVFLHELGHALMAREFGIATRDITMLPVGGLARLERMPERPSQEIAVAVAGPAVNLVIATMIFLGFFITGGRAGWLAFNPVGGSFLAQLMWANLAIVVFNPVAGVSHGWRTSFSSHVVRVHENVRQRRQSHLLSVSYLPWGWR